eukprot:s1547_g13.t1
MAPKARKARKRNDSSNPFDQPPDPNQSSLLRFKKQKVTEVEVEAEDEEVTLLSASGPSVTIAESPDVVETSPTKSDLQTNSAGSATPASSLPVFQDVVTHASSLPSEQLSGYVISFGDKDFASLLAQAASHPNFTAWATSSSCSREEFLQLKDCSHDRSQFASFLQWLVSGNMAGHGEGTPRVEALEARDSGVGAEVVAK